MIEAPCIPGRRAEVGKNSVSFECCGVGCSLKTQAGNLAWPAKAHSVSKAIGLVLIGVGQHPDARSTGIGTTSVCQRTDR